MYGTGDVIRELTKEKSELKQELRDKNSYIVSMEYALSYFLDWYWDIEEPGLVPNGRELRGHLNYAKRVLKNWRSDSDGESRQT